MPGTRCTVAVCLNSLIKTKRHPETSHIKYHVFPKNQIIKQQWIHRCRRDGQWNPNNAHVCSEHFKDDDFERDLQAELLNTAPRKKLKFSAVPSLKLGRDIDEETQLRNSERNIRNTSRSNRKIAIELVHDCTLQNETVTGESNDGGNIESDISMMDQLKRENEELQFKVSSLEVKAKTDQKRINRLKSELVNLKRKKAKAFVLNKKLNEILSTVFTKNQINIILGKRRKVRWTNEEISLAFTLRYFSKRSYLFIKNKMRIPLPGISTLQKWASSFNIRQGILSNVFQFLKVAGSTLKQSERVVVLQFDEVKVKKVLEYDNKEDEIVGPYSYMQVVMARGLFSKWKQPVYVNFDTKVTPELLKSIIIKLASIGYTVNACVSDMGGGNIGLWKELGITTDKTWFQHPTEEAENIYMFADAPHLLKLIRNWFLDTGFVLKGGQIVNKQPVEALIQQQSTSDLKMCHELTNVHISVEKTQRQNVRKACQLLSHKTASALEYLKPGNDPTLAMDTAAAIKIINAWFDLMNSYIPQNFGPPSKQAYGQTREQQNEILNTMLEFMETMRCCGKNSLQLFQKGCIVSTKSLKFLLDDLRRSHNIDYILTHRLNQDALENLFSQLRTRGGLNDHPSPLNALYRLRMIILGKNQGILQRNVNTGGSDDSEFVVASVMRDCGIRCSTLELGGSTDTEHIGVNDSVVVSMTLNDSKNQDFGEIENNAVAYLAGWVANKHHADHPRLGQVTRRSDQRSTPLSWVRHLSFGGLTEPSEEWMSQALQLEEEFRQHHGVDRILKGPSVVEKLVEIATTKFPSIPREPLQTFLRQRTFIRMKFLNTVILGGIATRKRASQCSDNSRQRIKKYRKVTT